MFSFSTSTKIGIYLIGLGFVFTVVGCLLFFDNGLLAVGQLGYFTGSITLIATNEPVRRLLLRPSMMMFISGGILVVIGWQLTGLVLEAISISLFIY
jgi:hypothetical protein